jgi:hypothetical protein
MAATITKSTDRITCQRRASRWSIKLISDSVVSVPRMRWKNDFLSVASVGRVINFSWQSYCFAVNIRVSQAPVLYLFYRKISSQSGGVPAPGLLQDFHFNRFNPRITYVQDFEFKIVNNDPITLLWDRFMLIDDVS